MTTRLASLAPTFLLAATLAPAPPHVIAVNRTRSWHARVTFWRAASARAPVIAIGR